jgi:hypothetical protein
VERPGGCSPARAYDEPGSRLARATPIDVGLDAGEEGSSGIVDDDRG